MAEKAYIIEIPEGEHNDFFIRFAIETCGISLCPIPIANHEFVFTTNSLLELIDCLDWNFYRFFNSDDSITSPRLAGLNELLIYLNDQLAKNLIS
ncbi:hypothetical protein SNE25_21495 [Mucilaginibacter sabulilitoris]|uniref:Uncharacterized protein n=1 Tax=Mucilaginibacter sabulilitoris TaxID=1173583 RepID=A0ABZ0TK28_9SPHI|nr:hypothetical protein [Mucilaginibacter sabulilitoris]WPU91895.1 hypothetical protein SNE25_21495 [Mucilaginibacter sabulilitoris]